MSEANERHNLLVRLQIPAGDYCYEVVKHDEKTGVRRFRYCPFWYGFRPNGGCMIYGWDAALGDACKACGWLQPDEPIF